LNIVNLKYISGRTTEQKPGRNSIVEGGILYISPRGFDYLQTKLTTDTSGLLPEALVDLVMKDLGVTDAEIQQRRGRRFNVVVDWDMIDV
jgi:hypothetical protein